MNVNVDIDDDYLDEAIRKTLFESYTRLKDGFLDKKQWPMFSDDWEVDSEMRFILIQSLRTVHNYFALPKDKITWGE